MYFLLWLSASSMTQICCFIIKRWKKLIGPCWKQTLSYCTGRFFFSPPQAFPLLSWLQPKLQSECRCLPFSITGWFSISSVFLHGGLAHMETKKSFTVANTSEKRVFIRSLLFPKQTQKPTIFCRNTTLYFCISRKARSEKRLCFHFR